jgi:hypothetical protein
VDGQAHGERAVDSRPRSGRVRGREFPGRRLRINPSFTMGEHGRCWPPRAGQD